LGPGRGLRADSAGRLVLGEFPHSLNRVWRQRRGERVDSAWLDVLLVVRVTSRTKSLGLLPARGPIFSPQAA
jgi:hypothetical protein